MMLQSGYMPYGEDTPFQDTGEANAENTGETKPNIQGLYIALELMDLGVALVRQRFIRDHPNADADAVTEYLSNWISTPRSRSIRYRK